MLSLAQVSSDTTKFHAIHTSCLGQLLREAERDQTALPSISPHLFQNYGTERALGSQNALVFK